MRRISFAALGLLAAADLAHAHHGACKDHIRR
jgi:hypothetical protein